MSTKETDRSSAKRNRPTVDVVSDWPRASEREDDTGRRHKGRLSPVDIVLFELGLAIAVALGLAVIAQLTL